MAARLTSTGGDVKLDPAPGVGFSGAAVTDAEGRFAGLALLKPALVAGPSGAAAQASLLPADIVRMVLNDARVTIAPAAADPKVSDIKAAVVRVICVRK
jgi:hypothetical protein